MVGRPRKTASSKTEKTSASKTTNKSKKQKKIDDFEIEETKDNKKNNDVSVIVKFPIFDDDIETDSDSEDLFRNIEKKPKKKSKKNECEECERLKDIINTFENGKNIELHKNRIIVRSLDILDIDTQKKIKKRKQKMYCLHDGEEFDGEPWYLPDKYVDGVFHVRSETFCSPECVQAHNIYELRDHKTKERTSLLYNMVKIALGYNNLDDVIITPAAHRKCLAKYGGNKGLTVNELRNNSIMNVKCIVCVPPMKAIPTIIEENVEDNDLFRKEDFKKPKDTRKKSSLLDKHIQ